MKVARITAIGLAVVFILLIAREQSPARREGEITLFNVKPTVGFTLPWAGVTPAPREKVKNAKLRAARYFALRVGGGSPMGSDAGEGCAAMWLRAC